MASAKSGRSLCQRREQFVETAIGVEEPSNGSVTQLRSGTGRIGFAPATEQVDRPKMWKMWWFGTMEFYYFSIHWE